MPRQARVIVSDMPHHIVQRGHNRNVVFVEERDYHYYLENLAEWKAELGLKVYSYCLMTNHVHLIIGANSVPGDVGRLMKRLAGRQTRFVNKMEGRTGTLWESRYKVSPIDTDAYLLQCCRYVELNPVKARMVSLAEDYKWSSFRSRIGLEECPWLDAIPNFDVFGKRERDRIEGYANFVNDLVDARSCMEFIGTAVERNQLTGEARFVEEVERRTGVRVESRGQGRPAKKTRW